MHLQYANWLFNQEFIMSSPDKAVHLDAQAISDIQGYGLQQRLDYLIKEVVRCQQIWILRDEHGCVMLNSDDEDCIPIWPHQEFAQSWATGDWQHCKPEVISLDIWQSRWSHGLEDDDLALALFPSLNDEGQVMYPDEFAAELKKQIDLLK